MARAEQTQMSPEEWRASTSLSGVYALRMLGMFLVLPVLSIYAASLPGAQNNAALAGFAAGMYGLTQALMQLPLGMASDRFGRKKTIISASSCLPPAASPPPPPTPGRCSRWGAPCRARAR